MEGIHYNSKHYNYSPECVINGDADRAKALQEFRQQKEAERSEFAAEFARLKQGGYRPSFGILETVGITPLLVGCEQVLQGSAIELLWIECYGGNWAAACLQGEAEELEKGLRAGLAAAKRMDEAALSHVFRNPPQALARWFQVGKLGRNIPPNISVNSPTNLSAHLSSKASQASQASQEEAYMQPYPEIKGQELQRRVNLQNTANLLECTDAELRELIKQNLHSSQQLPLSRLNSMHKEELVDYYNRIKNERIN